MQVSKATSSIGRLFGSMDIHYNNSLNTEVQKIQTKVIYSMILPSSKFTKNMFKTNIKSNTARNIQICGFFFCFYNFKTEVIMD